VTTPAGSPADDALQLLCARLRAKRLQARIDVATVGGEPDVRLQVCRNGGSDVLVELLAPDPPPRRPEHWDAVRIQCGGRRVWRGPDQDCSLDEVEEFVQALLQLGMPELERLYVDLG
jgi:hypothetical protein